jgi:RNA polymerase sigma factor (sigma-70 family)
MVRNLAIDFHRRKRPGLLEGDVASGHAAVSTPMEVAERRRQIDDALEELDDMSRQCVVMRYFRKPIEQEIGTALNVSPAAVDMRLSRARTQLRTSLSGIFVDLA